MSTDWRDRAYELMDEEIISARSMAEACLQYMSWDEIEDMLHSNEFLLDEDYANGEEEDG